MTATPAAATPVSPTDRELAESLPLSGAERTWSFLDVLSVKSGLAIATWAFLTGGVTAQYLGLRDGLWAMLLGNAIGVIVMLVGVVMPASRWGTEYFVHQRSVYGAVGIMGFIAMVVVAGAFAWAAILATMIGKAFAELARAAGLAELPFVSQGGAVLMLGVAWLFVARGSSGTRWLNRLAAPALVLLCLWLMTALFSQISLGALAAKPAISPLDDRAANVMLAIELNIANGMSWFGLAAALGRYASSPRAVVWGSFLAYVPVNVLAAVVGLASALALGSADPVTWMIPIVGSLGGIALLLLLSMANLSSLVSMAQGNCQTLVQHLGARLQSLGWSRFTLLFFTGTALLAWFASDALYDRFFTLMAFMQAIVAPTAGVALADAYVLRGNTVQLADLYDSSPQGAYRFWGHANPFAFLAMLSGSATYVLLVGPLHMTTTPMFVYVSASLPAVVTAAVVHVALSRFVVIPAGKGGYR